MSNRRIDLKEIIIICFLFSTTLSVNAQDVKLKISNIAFDMKKNNFDLYLEIYGNKERGVKIYKPQIEDICTSLVRIKFISQVNKNIGIVYPCQEVIDLESILINNENAIFLDIGEYFGVIMSFSCEEISPYLVEEIYDVQVELNYTLTQFIGDTQNLFKGDLKSNLFSVVNKN